MRIAIAGARGSGKSWLAAKLSEARTGHNIVEVGAEVGAEVGVEVGVEAKAQLANAVAATEAIEAASFDLIFLMGLDLPQAQPDEANGARTPLPNDDAQDQALRDTLARSGKAFHVIYGTGDARLQAALSAIDSQVATNSIATNAINTRPESPFFLKNSENWQWPCEKCSDPACEHLLFTRLIS